MKEENSVMLEADRRRPAVVFPSATSLIPRRINPKKSKQASTL
jgi:hypothetical protein